MSLVAGAVETEMVEHGPYRTHVARAGRGPVVLLLHGSGPGVSGRANWAASMTSELAERFTFVAPDVVGFGATTVDGDPPLVQATRVAHIADLIETLGLAPARIVGNSMGGGIALGLALRYRPLVRRMVLMGTSGISFPLTPEVDQLYGYEPSVEAMRGIFELMAFDTSMVTPELLQARYEATLAPGAQERFAAQFAPPRQRHIDDQALTEEELASIDVPTLLVHGAHDRVVPVDQVALPLVRLLPAADLLVLGRCGHWTQAERGEAFRRAIGDFFAEDAE